MKMGQDRIVAEALALLQDRGLERFNMRALATRLGVQASALYWHIGGKDELYSLMALRFYREAYQATSAAPDWRHWLLALGGSFREILLGHRDAARLCLTAAPLDGDGATIGDALAAPLIALGLSRQQALTFQGSVLALTLGWVVYEQSEALHDHLGQLFDFSESYRISLAALVSGLNPDPG